jgi:hypothetical protein
MLKNDAGTPADHGTLPLFDVTDVNISRTETHWTIQQAWNAHFGIGSDIDTGDWLNDEIAGTLFGTVFPRCSEKVVLQTIKASPIATDGTVVRDRTTVLTWTSSFTGGSQSGNPLPFENSIVASWQTPVLGPKGRGRVYWPVSATSVLNSDGRLGTTPRADFLADVVSMLEGFAITGGIGHSEWALPIVTGKPYTEYGQITGVRVGDVIDTQRRRRRQLAESYASAATSY